MWIVTMTKRKAVIWVLLGALAAIALILLSGALHREEGLPIPQQIETNEQRVAYLESLGWEVAPDPVETLELLLPEDGADTYASYNDLQKQQGFDLTDYLGRRVERFTYRITNYPGVASDVQANLYLCAGNVIAGDLFMAGEDGFQSTLRFPDQEGEGSSSR